MIAGATRLPALVLVAGAYVAGSAAAVALGGPWVLTAVLAALLGGAALLVDGHARWLVVVAAVCAAAAGHARLEAIDHAPPPPIASMLGMHEVVGVAREGASRSASRTRVDLDVETVDGVTVEGGLRLTLPPTRTPILGGERLRFRGELEPPPQLEDFDYAAFLRGRDIHVVAGFPREWAVEGRVDRGWRDALAALRRDTGRRIERSLPEPAAALAAGVLVGEQRTMSPALTEALRVTGTTHLVVVSGQNVALVLGLAIAALTAVISRRIAGIVALSLLAPYVVFVGADPPVVRAAVMAVAVALASIGGRRTPGWVYLLQAVAIMLAIDPGLARSVAFQLSAGATAGVLVVAPVLRDAVLDRAPSLRAPLPAALVEAFATATGASLAVLPVQVAVFERVPLWSVPANVAVAPLYEATVVVAVAAGILGDLGPAAAAVREVGRFVPEAFLAVVELFARLPAADLPMTAPLLAGGAFLVALALMLRWVGRHTRTHPALDPGRSTHLGTTVALAAAAAGLWLAVLRPPADLATVTVLDVGQGLAVLVRDGGNAVLIDTGPPDGTVLRALPAAGVRGSLGAVLVTHPDLDHVGGLDPVLQRLDVHAVLGEADAIEGLGLDGTPIDIGDRIHVSGRVTIEVLAPPVATRGPAHASRNDGSLVLLVTVGERRVLLPADIEAAGEAWLVASGQPIGADALVVPHHGSSSSSTPAFVAAVAPAVAVVSAGLDNRFGHPTEEVLERYEAATVLRTDRDGHVTLSSDGDRLWYWTQR